MAAALFIWLSENQNSSVINNQGTLDGNDKSNPLTSCRFKSIGPPINGNTLWTGLCQLISLAKWQFSWSDQTIFSKAIACGKNLAYAFSVFKLPRCSLMPRTAKSLWSCGHPLRQVTLSVSIWNRWSKSERQKSSWQARTSFLTYSNQWEWQREIIGYLPDLPMVYLVQGPIHYQSKLRSDLPPELGKQRNSITDMMGPGVGSFPQWGVWRRDSWETRLEIPSSHPTQAWTLRESDWLQIISRWAPEN